MSVCCSAFLAHGVRRVTGGTVYNGTVTVSAKSAYSCLGWLVMKLYVNCAFIKQWTLGSSNYANYTKAMRQGGTTLRFLMGDHLGSTSLTVTTGGAEAGELRYYPWGGTRYISGSTPTTFHFTGSREQSEIGLYFYGARWYDSALGSQFNRLYIPTQKVGCPLYVENQPRQPIFHWTEL